MRALAIDPGLVTGIAFMDTEEDVRPSTEEVPGGLPGFVRWWYDDMALHGCPEMIFIEDWLLRPNTHKLTRQSDAYEILGYVKGRCMLEDIAFEVIGPAEHTPFSGYKTKTKSKLIKLGWSNPSKDDHADSASSVLLLGLYRNDRKAIAPLLLEIV